MGFNDHYPIDFSVIMEKCPKCGKTFELILEEHTPGFRTPEDKVCPYCNAILKTSMEYGFTTRRL